MTLESSSDFDHLFGALKSVSRNRPVFKAFFSYLSKQVVAALTFTPNFQVNGKIAFVIA